MRIPTAARLAVLLFAAPPLIFAMQQQGGLPDSVLKELKGATVYIKVTEDADAWSGTGFLFRKEGLVGYIATNAHVADGDPQKRKVNVIFNSGMTGEFQVPAEVMILDHDHDLAILQVRSPTLPKPIDTRSRQKLKETQVLYTVGFPLGGALSAGAKNPEATFGKASVSSLRTDESGEVRRVQLDGEVNPGNSGGPAVDDAGDLVGVVFAKIRGTRIGFAIPGAQLEDLVQGRAVGLNGEITEVNREGAKLRIRTELCDPFSKIRSVSVIWAPQDVSRPLRWVREPVQPNMKDQPLKIDRGTAWGDLSIPSRGLQQLAIVLQIRVVRGDGVVQVGYPEPVILGFFDSVTALEEIRMWQDALPVFTVLENKAGKARCGLELALLIPPKVRSAALIIKRSPATTRLPRPGRAGLWGRMGGDVRELPLTLAEGRAVGELEVAADPGGGPVTLVLQGQVELEDRRKVYTSPIVQVVPFARPGIVRPVSKDDWIVTTMGKDRDAGKKPGAVPVTEGVVLAGESKKVLDASVKKIALAGKDFVGQALWSADGRHVYLLEKSGTLRMLAVPELNQVRSLPVGAPCSHLAMSKEGLVVHSPILGEIWILDDATLEFRRKVTASGIQHLAASPGMSLAYASANTKLLVIDLKDGRVVRQIVANDYSAKHFDKVKKPQGAPPLWAWGWLGLTPDGTYLIVVDRRMLRFRVSGTDLAWEEIGPNRRELTEVTISPDGKYLAGLENSEGSRDTKSRPAIYLVKELGAPLLNLPSGMQSQRMALAFDKEAGKLYCAEYGMQIVVFSPKGERAKQYEIEPAASVDFMLAHPSGNRLLLATPNSMYWVEFGN